MPTTMAVTGMTMVDTGMLMAVTVTATGARVIVTVLRARNLRLVSERKCERIFTKGTDRYHIYPILNIRHVKSSLLN